MSAHQHNMAQSETTWALRVSFLLLATMVFGMTLMRTSSGIEWSVDKTVAADNFVATVTHLITGSMLLALVFRPGPWLVITPAAVGLAFLGNCIEDFGWAMHRGYWYPWRVARDLGFAESAEKIADFAWVTTLAFSFIWCGQAMSVSMITRSIFGKWWAAASVAFIIVLWTIGYQSSTIIHEFVGCGPAKPVWSQSAGACRPH